MRSTWLAIVLLVKRSRFSFLVVLSTYVPYGRKKLTFAISSPEEFLSFLPRCPDLCFFAKRALACRKPKRETLLTLAL